MSERTQGLRKLIYSHDPYDPAVIIKALLDELDTLAAHIKGLYEAASTQQERHDNQISDLRRQIQQLKGVHGA